MPASASREFLGQTAMVGHSDASAPVLDALADAADGAARRDGAPPN